MARHLEHRERDDVLHDEPECPQRERDGSENGEPANLLVEQLLGQAASGEHAPVAGGNRGRSVRLDRPQVLDGQEVLTRNATAKRERRDSRPTINRRRGTPSRSINFLVAG